MGSWGWCPAPYALKQQPDTELPKQENFQKIFPESTPFLLHTDKYCTCSLWPCGKYTTRLPTGGNDTRGPAQACHNSELMGFFSPGFSNKKKGANYYTASQIK